MKNGPVARLRQDRSFRLRRWTLGAVLALGLSVGACFHQVQQTGPHGGASIERAELERFGSENLLDVVRRLRPLYLRDHGRISLQDDTHDVARVFIGTVDYGPIESLQQLRANDIERVIYWPPTDAAIQFGKSYSLGVIQLIYRVQ